MRKVKAIIWITLSAVLAAGTLAAVLRGEPKGAAPLCLFITIWFIVLGIYEIKRTPKKPLYTRAKAEQVFGRYLGRAFVDRKKPGLRRTLLEAAAYYGSGDYDSSLARLRSLEPQCVTDREYAAVYAFMGLNHVDKKDYRLGVSAYRNSLAYDENQPVMWSNLATALSNSGRPEEGLEAALRSIELDGTDAFPYNNAATALYRLDRYEEVIPYAEKALELKSNFPQASNVLCLTWLYLGDEEKSEYYYQMSRKLGSDMKKMDLRREEILRLRERDRAAAESKEKAEEPKEQTE